MGAGSFAAGLGSAGHDPVETATKNVVDPSAVLGSPRFNPLTKQYAVGDDGQVLQDARGLLLDDPIWQEVEHRLGIPLNAIASEPDLGIDVKRIRNAPRSQAQATVEAEVTRALAPMIERGDVVVEKVVLAEPWSGKWESWVKNLRSNGNDGAAVAFPSP